MQKSSAYCVMSSIPRENYYELLDRGFDRILIYFKILKLKIYSIENYFLIRLRVQISSNVF